MEAKTVLHNIDQVFPEITHHLQTMTAVRYILHCEQENVDGFLRAGELNESEHEEMSADITKSLRKLLAHPKPTEMTPQFSQMMKSLEKHQETLGSVIKQLNQEGGMPGASPLPKSPSLRFGRFSATPGEAFLADFTSWAKMVYLRAGDLVYEQGGKNDHTGKVGRAGMGIYFIARGSTTSCLVPGKIVLSRRARDAAYFKQLSQLRSNMLHQLFSSEAVQKRRDSSKLRQRDDRRRRASTASSSDLASRLQSLSRPESAEQDMMNQFRNKDLFPDLPKSPSSASMETTSKLVLEEDSKMIEEDNVFDDGADMPSVERDAVMRSAVMKTLESLVKSYASTTSGRESVDRIQEEIPGLGDLMDWYSENSKKYFSGRSSPSRAEAGDDADDGDDLTKRSPTADLGGNSGGGSSKWKKKGLSKGLTEAVRRKFEPPSLLTAEQEILDLFKPTLSSQDMARQHGAGAFLCYVSC